MGLGRLWLKKLEYGIGCLRPYKHTLFLHILYRMEKSYSEVPVNRFMPVGKGHPRQAISSKFINSINNKINNSK